MGTLWKFIRKGIYLDKGVCWQNGTDGTPRALTRGRPAESCIPAGDSIIWTTHVDKDTGKAPTEHTQESRYELRIATIPGGTAQLLRSDSEPSYPYVTDDFIAWIADSGWVTVRDLNDQAEVVLYQLGQWPDVISGLGNTLMTLGDRANESVARLMRVEHQ